MTPHLRPAHPTDLPFLRKMLYEAVYWRDSANKPTFAEALALPVFSIALADWGEQDGETAVIATSQSNPVGAAWYRTMTDDNHIRGYIDETIPVLVIGVHSEYRHQGIGGKLIEWLIDHAANHAVPKISLMVSKDNYALNLYQQQGFLEYADTGDSLLMVRDI